MESRVKVEVAQRAGSSPSLLHLEHARQAERSEERHRKASTWDMGYSRMQKKSRVHRSRLGVGKMQNSGKMAKTVPIQGRRRVWRVPESGIFRGYVGNSMKIFENASSQEALLLPRDNSQRSPSRGRSSGLAGWQASTDKFGVLVNRLGTRPAPKRDSRKPKILLFFSLVLTPRHLAYSYTIIFPFAT